MDRSVGALVGLSVELLVSASKFLPCCISIFQQSPGWMTWNMDYGVPVCMLVMIMTTIMIMVMAVMVMLMAVQLW